MRLTASFATAVVWCAIASGAAPPSPSTWAVGPQYDSTHVYVAPEDLDRFVASFVGTFGGTASEKSVTMVTPTPSRTTFQFALTPVGTLSVFAFQTPIPYPFGAERTGYLVRDLEGAARAAHAAGADVLVAPFPDPIGKDVVIQWPGGVNMQLYWHTKPPSYDDLQTIPENRVYLSPMKADEFIRAFTQFSYGKVVLDDPRAAGVGIGRPGEMYRLVRIESSFGKMSVLVTDGHLPFPYGRELTGYEVRSLPATLSKAKAAGVTVLAGPYVAGAYNAALVQFPGGYIAEIHSRTGN